MSERRRERRPGSARLAAAAIAAALTLVVPAPAATAVERPNVVVITTDDQPAAMTDERYMPLTSARFGAGGTRFTSFIATTPLCCPSRASLLTGQYAHNHGVLDNSYPRLRMKRNLLPVWLRRSGYETAHVGRWLNKYHELPGQRLLAPAPGWDRWFTLVPPRRYYRYQVSADGRRRRFRTRDRDHLTRVLNHRSQVLASRLARRRAPFYLQVDHLVPHTGQGRPAHRCLGAPKPVKGDLGGFDDEPLPQDLLGLDRAEQSFNEIDLSDKPEFLRAQFPDPGLDEEQVAAIAGRWRCGLEALQAVDRGVERIFAAVEAAGELERTVFVFTSDNGYFYGEHRIPLQKRHLYEENTRVPLLIRVPAQLAGGSVPETVAAPAANIDLAPTILALTGSEPCNRDRCRTMDGRSLLGLLDGTTTAAERDRALLIQHRVQAGSATCAAIGVRTFARVYLRYGVQGGEDECGRVTAEHYDLRRDPLQLDNLAPAPPGSPNAVHQVALAARTDALTDCSGIPGRDPVPASGRYCE